MQNMVEVHSEAFLCLLKFDKYNFLEMAHTF